jgi:hypothetical protein
VIGFVIALAGAAVTLWPVETTLGKIVTIAGFALFAGLLIWANVRQERESEEFHQREHQLTRGVVQHRTLTEHEIGEVVEGLQPIRDWYSEHKEDHPLAFSLMIFPTLGAPDSPHYADCLAKALRAAFAVDVWDANSWHYEPQSIGGLLLLVPRDWPPDYVDCAKVIVAAFARIDIEVSRLSASLPELTMLVGKKTAA